MTTNSLQKNPKRIKKIIYCYFNRTRKLRISCRQMEQQMVNYGVDDLI